MPAYVRLQEAEFALEAAGYTAHAHQREVGAGYFDQVLMTVRRRGVHDGAARGLHREAQFQ
jgi:isocitrate lyase